MNRISLLTALCLVALLGCGQPSPRPVALSDLAANAASYKGQQLRLEGTVQFFSPPAHAWIEDNALNRVELLPLDAVSEYVGQQVSVTGTFDVGDGRGRRLRVEQITPIE